MVGSQWSGKVGCFLVFFMIPSGAGNLHSNPDFQIHTIQRWSHLKTWNQSLVILDIPNFNPMKEALWYSHPLSRYLIFSDGPRLYLQKKEWYVHIVRGPWTCKYEFKSLYHFVFQVLFSIRNVWLDIRMRAGMVKHCRAPLYFLFFLSFQSATCHS